MATLTAQHINQLKNIVGESFVFFVCDQPIDTTLSTVISKAIFFMLFIFFETTKIF